MNLKKCFTAGTDPKYDEIYYNGHDQEGGGALFKNPDDGHVYAGGGGGKSVLFSDLLAPKLEDTAIINFAGCKTAQILGFDWSDNITQAASRDIPGVPITGCIGMAFGNEVHFFDLWSSGPIFSDHTEVNFGVVKTYENGEGINGWGSGNSYWYDTWKKSSNTNPSK